MEYSFDLTSVELFPGGPTLGSLALTDRTFQAFPDPVTGLYPQDGAMLNPFLHLRFSARITPPSPPGVPPTTYVVPGFFAGDGSQGDAQGGHIGAGAVWKLRFAPDHRVGNWDIFFVLDYGTGGLGSDGRPINVSDDAVPTTGTSPGVLWSSPWAFQSFRFNPQAQGHYARGFLRSDPDMGRYLRYSCPLLPLESQHFIKTGTNSPENLFGYREFYLSDKDPRYTMNPAAMRAALPAAYPVDGPGTGEWLRLDATPQGNLHDPLSHAFDDWAGPEWITTVVSYDPITGLRNLAPINGPMTQRAGHGIIGAINYLGSQGVNSIYVIPMNLGGDGRDTHPFADIALADLDVVTLAPTVPRQVFNYSIKRMQEWNIVAQHAMSKGILIQFQLHETESANQNWLGYNWNTTNRTAELEPGFNPNAPANVISPLRNLTHARRLYLKQMVAHFGHNPAVQWTLCEENYTEPGQVVNNAPVAVGFTVPQLEAMAKWIGDWDALHDHPIAVHAHGWDDTLYQRIVQQSTFPWLDVTSDYIYGGEPQTSPGSGPDMGPATGRHLYDKETEDQRSRLVALGPNGQRVAISIDEPGEWKYGLAGTNNDAAGFANAFYAPTLMSSPEARRQLALYDVLFSGGSIEHYSGYGMELDGFDPGTYARSPTKRFGGTDVSVSEFRSRRWMWQYSRVARSLLAKIPFWAAVPRDELVKGEHNDGNQSGPNGLLTPANGGAYGIGTFGQAQVLAYENNTNPISDASYLIYYPEAYTIPVGQRTSSTATPQSLGMLYVPWASGMTFSVDFFSPIDGSVVGGTKFVQAIGGYLAIDTPEVSLWIGGAAPDIVCLVRLGG